MKMVAKSKIYCDLGYLSRKTENYVSYMISRNWYLVVFKDGRMMCFRTHACVRASFLF